jgi:hypothetical protein
MKVNDRTIKINVNEKYLKEIIGDILDVFKTKGINSNEALESRVRTVYQTTGYDHVSINFANGMPNSKAYLIEFKLDGRINLFRATIDLDLNKNTYYFRFGGELGGYNKHRIGSDGNVEQSKISEPGGLSEFLHELESIVQPKEPKVLTG